jgi:hypothetical protein
MRGVVMVVWEAWLQFFGTAADRKTLVLKKSNHVSGYGMIFR